MHVLVTGAAGFIGSHLCERLLADGHAVVGLDNLDPFYDPARKQANLRLLSEAGGARFHFVQADLRDRAALARAVVGADAVVHLAALAGVRPSIERPLDYAEVNITGTTALLEAMRGAGVRRLVFGSSSSVYGNLPTVPFREDARVDRPISPYAASKRAGELLCHTWHHLHGLSVACLRFFTVYGPRQRPDLAIAKFTDLIARGQPLPFYGDGTASRDYTYVADIVDGIVRTLAWTAAATPQFDLINLGNSAPVDLSTLVATIEQAVGRPAELQRLPMQPGDVERTFADIAKARTLLGWAPSTPLADGIAQQVTWTLGRAHGSPLPCDA
jgi:UDP-glucuronate 4-epimerase